MTAPHSATRFVWGRRELLQLRRRWRCRLLEGNVQCRRRYACLTVHPGLGDAKQFSVIWRYQFFLSPGNYVRLSRTAERADDNAHLVSRDHDEKPEAQVGRG